MRDKIAGIIWHDRQGQNTPESVADAILATIKADDDAKYKQGFDDGCAHMKEDYDAGRRLDENAKDKRIEALEAWITRDKRIEALEAWITRKYPGFDVNEAMALFDAVERDDVWDCPTG
jgi:hypothetical protein